MRNPIRYGCLDVQKVVLNTALCLISTDGGRDSEVRIPLDSLRSAKVGQTGLDTPLMALQICAITSCPAIMLDVDLGERSHVQARNRLAMVTDPDPGRSGVVLHTLTW